MTLTERAAAAAELKTTGQCNCTQSVIKVFEDKLPVESDTLRMLAAGYAAGMGCMESTCGALIGAVMVAGILTEGCPGMTDAQAELARLTNASGLTGDLAAALRGADAFIGVSAPGLVTADMVRTMAPRAVVFACANPVPEIMPEEALRGGAAVVASGRSDAPNQINNVLAFPGIFRGALDVRARDINRPMQLAAAQALSALVSPAELAAGKIIPEPFDPRVGPAVAAAVAPPPRPRRGAPRGGAPGGKVNIFGE